MPIQRLRLGFPLASMTVHALRQQDLQSGRISLSRIRLSKKKDILRLLTYYIPNSCEEGLWVWRYWSWTLRTQVGCGGAWSLSRRIYRYRRYQCCPWGGSLGLFPSLEYFSTPLEGREHPRIVDCRNWPIFTQDRERYRHLKSRFSSG